MCPPSGAIRVLHVDDEPAFAGMVATFLERTDDRFEVETATSASDGVDRLADGDFDCVVSDYDMPGQNGIEFLEAVREESPDLPFILYTGKGSEEIASDAISAGVTDYLQKETGTSQYTVLTNRISNAVEQYRSKRQIEASQRRLSLFFEQSPLGVIEWNEAFECVRVNDRAQEILGYSEREMRGDSWERFVPETDRQQVSKVVDELLDARGGYHSINENIRKDGERIVCEWHNRVVTDDAGNTVAIFSQFQDITERRERKQELEQTNTLLSTLFETLPVGILAEDADRNVLAVNERLFELFEMPGSPEEVIGADCERMAEEVCEMFAEPNAFVERINHLVSERVPTDGEELSLDDGRVFDRSYRPIRLQEGDGHIWVYREITARKTIEQTLKDRTEELGELTAELEEQYRHLFEEAPVMAVVTRAVDGKPVIEDCNQLFLDRLGYDRSDVIDRELAEFYTPESAETLLEEGGYERALSGEFVREDRTLVRADDERLETLLRAVPRCDAGDTVTGTIAMYIDISERKELERKTERLEEFNRIVSHDLRNPLTVAKGQLELARTECDSSHLTDLARALDRMSELIEDLLTLAHEGEAAGETESIDVTSLLRMCWENVATAEATLETELDRRIQADRSRLQQLLENLIRNAIEHGGDDVTITVGESSEGFYIEDDGPGIPEGDRDDVFITGYSTAEEGTGFGLSIAKRVADAHDWTIHVTESADGGARFEITGVEFVE